MSRGGYFAGGDYVPYQPGTLSYSTPTSAKEFRKQKTAYCPKCKREVPLRKKCVFCGNILINQQPLEDIMNNNDMKNLKNLNERYGLTNMTGFKLVSKGTDKETLLKHLEMDLKILKTSDVKIKNPVRILYGDNVIDIGSYDNGTPVTYFFTQDAELKPEDIIADVKELSEKYGVGFEDFN